MGHVVVVTKAEYVSGATLDLEFSDGVRAEIDFSGWIDRYPFFEPLRDPAYFRNFTLDGWTVVWPNGADIAPETLHAIAVEVNQLQAA
jgi:hypothetical protein